MCHPTDSSGCGDGLRWTVGYHPCAWGYAVQRPGEPVGLADADTQSESGPGLPTTYGGMITIELSAYLE